MAKKRVVEVDAPLPEAGEDEPKDIPEKFIDKGWKEWFVADWLRYWFFLSCILLDAFVGLQLAYSVTGEFSVVVFFIFILAAVVGEYFLYSRFWPKKT